MSIGILTSTLQAVKSFQNHECFQRLQEFTKKFATSEQQSNYSSHMGTRKTRLQLIRLSAAVCGIELCYAAETAFVSPILLKLGVPVAFMTLVWCVSPLLGFFLVPLMGSLSDRCPSSLGRRRPFILLLSVGIILGLILVPNGETLGVAMGDKGVMPRNFSETPINATSKLVDFGNGTSVIHRSDFRPAWPSMNLPGNRVAGIILTILGVALLDFNCDACQSPCRTYLLDISSPEDHSRGLTSFTIMAGLGGSVGYLMGGVNWEATSFGTALGGHVRVVFTTVLILFLVSVYLTVSSFKEIPLKELTATSEQCQKKVKKVKKAKYRRFVNESSDDDIEEEKIGANGGCATYGTLSKQNIPSEITKTSAAPNGMFSKDEKCMPNGGDNSLANGIKVDDVGSQLGLFQSESENKNLFNLLDDISLKTYLKSIVRMPRSLLVLCLTNLFCWMSLVCYSLYFTDFVGQSVFGGRPDAPKGSKEHSLYDEGVRLGSFGMSLYSLSCAAYSVVVEKLVEKFKAKRVYICGQLVYTVGMVILAVSRDRVAVILLSPCAGVMYATLFTMPYLLVAHYHSSGRFSQMDDEMSSTNRIRGLGTDVAVVSSMVFLAQFLLSLFMGGLVHLVGSTVTIVIAAAILSFLGAISATQVTYLDL